MPPLKPPAQRRHYPPGGIVSPVWFGFPLLVKRRLFPEEEVLRGHASARAKRHNDQQSEIEQYPS